jgi:hypothetical protein
MSIHKDSAELMISQIEGLRHEQLSQDERDRIELWQKGRALEQQVSTYGWECVLEMLQSYVVEANKVLVAISPANKDEVAAQHAVVYALSSLYNNFSQDVQRAIEFEAPECVLEFVRLQGPAAN